MILGAAILLFAFVIAPVMAVALASYYIDPERRLRTGAMLLSETDAACFLCGREHAPLVLRNRWLQDMPACDACMVRAHGSSPTFPEFQPRLVKRRGLEDDVPPGKPMPKF